QRHLKLERFITKTLKWSVSKFSNFVQIARNPNIQKLRQVQPDKLPPSWTALYEIACLEGDQFADALKANVINQDATVAELKFYRGKLIASPRVAKDETR
ncbi:hypothetical protein JZU71_04885, partial [bacterium]|nr:hypothetical protein [bacterium]